MNGYSWGPGETCVYARSSRLDKIDMILASCGVLELELDSGLERRRGCMSVGEGDLLANPHSLAYILAFTETNCPTTLLSRPVILAIYFIRPSSGTICQYTRGTPIIRLNIRPEVQYYALSPSLSAA